MKNRKTAVAFILMAVIAITACAQNYEDEKFFSVRPINEGKAVEITGYSGSKYEVSIPPQIKNLPVTSITDNAFNGKSDIVSVTIPNSVTNIGKETFRKPNFTAINVAGGNKTYASQDGVLYDKNKKTLILYPRGKTATTFTIPNGVTTIGDNAFYNCNFLTSVTIPNSVTNIEKWAFSNCKSLTTVTLGNSITSIGDYAFSSSGLTSVTIPTGVTSIGNVVFSECKSLTSVTIPNSVTSIGDGAFEDCSKLTNITIPDSVISIKGQAFFSGLTSITFQGTIASDKLGNLMKDGYQMDFSPFRGDLRDKYLAGGPGTYIVVEQDFYGFAKTWKKQ